MADYATSAYDGADEVTVDDILSDPLTIQEMVGEPLTGAFLEAALFRNAGSNDGSVAFREATAPFLNDDAGEVSEFGEIPVSEPSRGARRTLFGIKTALAVRASYEMKRENNVRELLDRVRALQETMIKSGVEASLAAFDAATIPTMQAAAAWDVSAGNPVMDLRVAKRTVATAKQDGTDNLMGYRPDTLVVGPGTMDLALWHESTQRFYNGSSPVENPLFLGITPQMLAGLRVVESSWFPEGEALVMQSGIAGFFSDTDPLTVTPFYEEGGNSGYGGPRQSWRSDAFRKRVIAIDNPKAVLRITGIETPATP